MKPCDRYLNAIDELVEGTLGPLRRAELELHLEGCDACRALAEDLQEIARAAHSLEALDPPERAWTAIAARLRQEGRISAAPTARHRPNHVLLALAASLVLAVASAVLLVLPRDRGAAEPRDAVPAGQQAETGAPGDASDATALDPVEGVSSKLALTEKYFQSAVEQADQVVNPETKAVLRKSLLVMNEALAESRSALENDPQSLPARQSFYETLRQKIQFLQDTIALMNEMRQGNAAGAAQIIESGKS